MLCVAKLVRPLSVILVLLTLGALTNAAERVMPRRPNILFLFSDDHATQAIGAYGSKINKTPNIDRLAKEGAVFVNSFCANSLCGPSRACILTGKHSHLNGFMRNGDQFDSLQTTFPPLLQKAGYQTALIGKWHLGTDPVGFDHWEILPGQGKYYNPDFLQMDGSRKHREGYCTDLITDMGLQWLKDQRDSKKPFLLMCQYKAPHRNWSPALRHLSLYDDRDIPQPDTLNDDYEGRSKLLKENEMSLRNHLIWGNDLKFHGKNLFPKYFLGRSPNHEYNRMTPAQREAWDAHYEPLNQEFIKQMQAGELSDDDILNWKYQRYVKDYLRTIAAVDEGVGRVLDYLDESGLAENTVVIYASDQGFYLGEHGWYDKRWMFEESLQMPFLIRWPNVISGGNRSTTMIQNIDYAPTFLDVAHVGIPAEMQGRSLVPVLRNQCQDTSDWRDAIYYAYYENVASHNVPIHDGVRTDRYKLMYFVRTGEWNLFDLQNDPNEMVSLHNDPEYADRLAGLKQRYGDLRRFYEVNTATIQIPRHDESWWRERNAKVVNLAKNDAFDLAFIGDSITQGWERSGKEVWQEFYGDRRPINLGFSGDRTEHVIWRLQHGNLGKMRPKVAVVMIGTNNTGQLMQSPGEVVQGIRKIIDILQQRSPKTQIVLHGIFPRGATPLDPMRLNNTAINQAIRRLADGKHIHYLDIGNIFLEEGKTLTKNFSSDLIHLNAKGYRLWAEALEPKLVELGL